jgi:hypothetical protein
MAARVQVQSNMADYRLPMYEVPRKPMGTTHAGFQFEQPADTSSPQQQLNRNVDHTSFSHQRNRTTSSTALPDAGGHSNRHPHKHFQHRPGHHVAPSVPSVSAGHQVPSRKLSNATTSTSSTGGNYPKYTMSSISDIHRSSSSRSAPVQLGYVALMRRQKGTVWCDRAQPEDPRLLAQKRAAKQRAYMELHEGSSGRTGTLGSGKIRHSGKSVPGFAPSTLVGATVPVRLSANEIGDDDGDDHSSEGGFYHRRTASGRSSMGSIQRYPSGYQRPQGKTPPNEQADIPEVAETAPAGETRDHEGGETVSKEDDTSVDKDAEENDFGGVGDLSAPPAADAVMQKSKKAEDLRRRGSVDERTSTMTGVRLFVANPDNDD